MAYILALDQGTTSSRAMIFDDAGAIRAVAQREFRQIFPQPGWVEHDPGEIWGTQFAVAMEVMARASIHAADVSAIGITNQRETILFWNRRTGRPLGPAIVWQDRRTAGMCDALKAAGYEDLFIRTTGLLLDPYFSGTKAAWLLNTIRGARKRAEAGALAFGTIDTFLISRLTGGRVHATDATNASRTLMFDINTGAWSAPLLEILGVPRSLLPEVKDSAAEYGATTQDILGAEVPILGVAGDQQAATVGQACFAPGMLKSTYGTGCFAMLNTGDTPVRSSNRLLTTIAYQLDGRRTYALEGSIFIAGAAVQWLRDGLKIIHSAEETAKLASSSDPNQDVFLVPAFVGLGAPHWDANARGAIFGITRGTTSAELARAALESVCYQTADLLDAMRRDWGAADSGTVVRVDGGMANSDWTMQHLADVLAVPVDRPKITETTALGAAYLAGHRAGLYPEPDAFAAGWKLDRRFKPRMKDDERRRKLAGWRDAVSRTLAEGPA